MLSLMTVQLAGKVSKSEGALSTQSWSTVSMALPAVAAISPPALVAVPTLVVAALSVTATRTWPTTLTATTPDTAKPG